MKKLVAGILMVLTGALYGCGGGGENSGPKTATGTFVDAPVDGLSYVSGSIKGTTKDGGKFTYEIGQPVTFSIGDVVIGTARGATVITPVTLSTAPDADASTADVQARVQFLMSISSTDPSKAATLDVSGAADKLKGKSINFAGARVQRELQTLVAAVDSTKTVVAPTAATAHLTQSVTAAYSDLISGKSFLYSSQSGTTTFTFNSDYSFVTSRSSATNKTWSINSRGQIVITGTGNSGTGTTTITLLSSELVAGQIQCSLFDSESGNTQIGTLDLPTHYGTPTKVMLAGTTLYYTAPSGSAEFLFYSNGNFGTNEVLVYPDGRFGVISRPSANSRTWSVNSRGQIVITGTGDSGTGTTTVTILSGNFAYWMRCSVFDSESGNTEIGPLTSTWPTPGFTTAMLAGHTVTLTSSTGLMTYVFAATSNAVTVNGTTVGTWAIDLNDTLIITTASGTDILPYSPYGGNTSVFITHVSAPMVTEGPWTMTVN